MKCDFQGVALGDSWISPIGENKSTLTPLLPPAPLPLVYIQHVHVVHTCACTCKMCSLIHCRFCQDMGSIPLCYCEHIAHKLMCLYTYMYTCTRTCSLTTFFQAERLRNVVLLCVLCVFFLCSVSLCACSALCT